MTATAADLVEHVIPNVPLRQLVLTLPFELRARLAYDGELLGGVSRAFLDSVLGWYQRHMRARGIADGKSGAVTVVQRVSSDLRLNPHLHSLCLDGVYAESAGGELAFHPLPFLTNDDVGDLLQIARARILALLRRKGVLEDDTVTSDAALADREPALAELAAASVAGTLPAGPALRRRDPIKLRGGSELEHTKALCAAEGGFSLHAATTAKAGDATGREALCKYILRPPIAQERVRLIADDLVRIELKRPFSDGTFALDLDPLALLVRLATTVPPPGFHTIRYAGVLAAASKWRARVVPPPPPTSHDALCLELLGPGVQPFSSGPDGGRDARFDGAASKFPSATNPLQGQFVIQAKHTENPCAKFSDADFSGDAASAVLTEELPSVAALVAAGELEHYLLFSNRRLAGVADGDLRKRIKDSAGATTVELFGIERIDVLLRSYPEVARIAELPVLTGPLLVSPDDLAEVILALDSSKASGYGTERLRSRLACNLTYVNEGLDAFVRSGSYESAVARSTARTGLAPG